MSARKVLLIGGSRNLQHVSGEDYRSDRIQLIKERKHTPIVFDPLDTTSASCTFEHETYLRRYMMQDGRIIATVYVLHGMPETESDAIFIKHCGLRAK